MLYKSLGLAVLILSLVWPQTTPAQESNTAQAVLETYAEIVYASYEDSLTLAVALQEAIEAFLAAPSAETFQAAKAAWLISNEPYGQTEVYRFYGGPIDDENGPEGFLNAWPLDEAYIDYVAGDASAGIINNPEAYPQLNEALLTDLNEQGSEKNIATGYHAIEFLLWGQDLSAETNGQRPYTDYTSAPNAERRATYLRIVAAKLVSDLEYLVAAWAPAEENYRAAFVGGDPNEGLMRILTGMGVLSKSELAGERMFTAYDNQDQEDEHSCFSDNTHRDIITNAQGIANVYVGRYTRLDGSVVEGTGLSALVEEIDPELNALMLEALDNSLALVNSIPTPFDQAIIDPTGRKIILEAVFSLQDQGDLIAEIATALGLVINTALPE